MSRILVVEDEQSFSETVSFMLEKEGFEVEVAATGPDGLAAFKRGGIDLILLDVMLPGMSGTDVCRAIRQDSSVPIIMLTARDSELDKVLGLELGADDYVTKPFSMRELVARVRAVLRRPHDVGSSDDAGIVAAGPVRIDIERHVVTIEGREVSLPLKEFDLLELLDRVWGSDYFGDTKTLDVHVKRLRGKLEADPANPAHLLTVRGLGYKFSA